jgi:protein gp37
MSDQTGIEWADSTFNPWMGCTKVSPACDHCYAERDTKRFGRVEWGQGKPRVRTSAGNWKKPLQWNTQAFVECPECQWRGEWREADVRNGCCPSCNHLPRLFKPARRRVFCASLADVFDNEVDPAWRDDLFALIESTPNLDWMLLTKRIGNVQNMLRQILRLNGLPPNVWLGATICNQEEADRDIPKLLAVPAAVRFLSMEPLLGAVDIESACDIAEAAHCAGTWDQMETLRSVRWHCVTAACACWIGSSLAASPAPTPAPCTRIGYAACANSAQTLACRSCSSSGGSLSPRIMRPEIQIFAMTTAG